MCTATGSNGNTESSGDDPNGCGRPATDADNGRLAWRDRSREVFNAGTESPYAEKFESEPRFSTGGGGLRRERASFGEEATGDASPFELRS
jgi:hypothetical protein